VTEQLEEALKVLTELIILVPTAF